ncbi:MAG TPA: translation initiation factor [Pirellulales bacterium]|jgi:translation initiation factor 1
MRLFAGTPYDRPPKCDRCGALEAECKCPPPSAPRVPPENQILRLAVEKRKKGKIVTLVSGLEGPAEHRAELLTQLKNICGAGGTMQDDLLELQGAHQERLREALIKLGYRVRP